MGVVGAGIARGWVDTGSLKEGFNTIGIHCHHYHCHLMESQQYLGSFLISADRHWCDALSWKLTIPFVCPHLQKTLRADFSLMRNIALSWIVTIPFAMALSALVYAVADAILIGWIEKIMYSRQPKKIHRKGKCFAVYFFFCFSIWWLCWWWVGVHQMMEMQNADAMSLHFSANIHLL